MVRSRTTTWVAGAAVLTVLVAVAAWSLLIGPVRAEAAGYRQATADAEVTNIQLEARLVQLREQYAELPQEQARLAELQSQLPPVADLPAFVRGVQAAADSAGVTLVSITPDTPVLAGTDPATGAPVTAVAPGLVQIPVVLEVVGGFAASTDFVRGVQSELTRTMLVTTLDVSASEDAADDPALVAGADLVTTTVTGSIFVMPDSETTPTP